MLRKLRSSYIGNARIRSRPAVGGTRPDEPGGAPARGSRHADRARGAAGGDASSRSATTCCSRLAAYIHALGGELELIARFPDADVRIRQFEVEQGREAAHG
jgi:hypothetical protein